MEVIKMTEVSQFKTPKGIMARKLLENQSFVIMNILLKPGEVLEKHEAPVDVFFYVVKGKGVILIGDEFYDEAKEITSMIY